MKYQETRVSLSIGSHTLRGRARIDERSAPRQVDRSEDIFAIIESYLLKTHAKTHTQ